jgi:hypothetical protein
MFANLPPAVTLFVFNGTPLTPIALLRGLGISGPGDLADEAQRRPGSRQRQCTVQQKPLLRTGADGPHPARFAMRRKIKIRLALRGPPLRRPCGPRLLPDAGRGFSQA